jgi:Ohr subfamily peroxiredoxin
MFFSEEKNQKTFVSPLLPRCRPCRDLAAGAGIKVFCFFSSERKTFLFHATRNPNMAQSKNVLYTARTHTTGGRDGASRSTDGRLDIRLSSPGTAGLGTNPEQLFAAGWSACFEGAMGLAAKKMNVSLPADLAIDAEVDLCLTDGAYHLQARLSISLPGMARDVARSLVDEAHQTCPYSKATHGNIDVAINLV